MAIIVLIQKLSTFMIVTITLFATVLNRVVSALLSKSQNTIRGLSKTFRKLDSFDHNTKVDKDEFFIGLKENGVSLTKQESYLLHQYFDKNHDGTVDFEEFLLTIRGDLSDRRRTVVKNAFDKFDNAHSGYVEVRDLRGIYNCSKHPKVVNGQMTEQEGFLEFLMNFIDNGKNGKIGICEWMDYYSAVSMAIQSDDVFEELIKNAWALN